MSAFRQLLALSAKGNQYYYPEFKPIGGMDENTLLMLHGDAYEDVSQYACPVTNSNTTIVTDVVKFKSAFKNTVAQSSNYYIYSKLPKKLDTVFTVDFWFYPTSYSPTYGSFFAVGTYYTNGIFFQLIDHMNIIDMYICGQQGTTSLKDKVPLNAWTHWALVGDGTKTVLYVNGRNVIQWGAKNIQQDDVYIFKTLGLGRSVPGYFEEIRISDVARWTEDFTPPDKPYSGSAGILPVGYTPLQYIESTGSQYIDTELIPNQDTEFEVKFSTTNALSAGGSFGTILGSRESYQSQGYQLTTYTMYTTGGHFMYGSNSNADLVRYEANINNTGVAQTISLRNHKLTTGNGDIVDLPTDVTINSSQALLLFGLRDRTFVGEFSSTKMYFCKLWNGENMVRSFVPALRDEDGAVGMYCMITNKFYSNSGTGDFVAGPEAEA